MNAYKIKSRPFPQAIKLFKLKLLFFFILLSACSGFNTSEPIASSHLPSDVTKFFSSCAPSEGGGNIKWQKKNFTLAEAKYDWIADNTQNFRFQLSDLFGRIMIELEWDHQTNILTTNGIWKRQLQDLKVNSNGYLEFKNINLGIKPSEIPCSLKRSFPLAWLNQIYNHTLHKNHLELLISNQNRTIKIVAKKDPTAKISKICTELKWTYFLGLKSSQTIWCISNKDRTSTLELPNKEFISWELIDD